MAFRGCEIHTLSDGTQVRVRGDIDPEVLETLAAEVRADQAKRCHHIGPHVMPALAQKIHGRETYWCGRYAGHEGPHRWPEDAKPTALEWPTDPSRGAVGMAGDSETMEGKR